MPYLFRAIGTVLGDIALLLTFPFGLGADNPDYGKSGGLFLTASPTGSLVPAATEQRWSKYNQEFKNQKLRIILNNENHPLRALIDPDEKDWVSSLPTDPLGVVAGHRSSKRSGEPISLAIEEAWKNSYDNRMSESRGQLIIQKPTVDVKGVEIDLDLVERLEREINPKTGKPYVPPGTAEQAPRVEGWKPIELRSK